MDKSIIYILVFCLLLMPISAFSELGVFEKGSTISLLQSCDSCTYVNLDSVAYPNGQVSFLNASMTKNSQTYNYTFSDTSQAGSYFYVVCGDKLGSLHCETILFDITIDGKVGGYDEAFKYLIFAAIGFFIYGLGLVYKSYIASALGGFIVFLLGIYTIIFPIAGFAVWMSQVIGMVMFGLGGYIWIMIAINEIDLGG